MQERAVMAETVQPGEGKAQGYLIGVCKGNQTLLSSVWWQVVGTKRKMENSVWKTQENTSFFDGGWTLEQIFQKSWEVSLCGNLKQSYVICFIWSCLVQWRILVHLQRVFQWFCELETF